MLSGSFRRSLPSDIEWHTLKFVPLQEVFVLQAVSTCAREHVRRTFVSQPWDVVLTCKSAGVAYRSLEELCDANANIRSISPKVQGKCIPYGEGYDETFLLKEAVRAHNVKLVKLLSSLEGFNINFTNMNGDTVLHRVASSAVATSSDIKIAKIILAHPHVDVNLRNREHYQQCRAPWGGDTPLHIAVREGNVEVVRMLMSRAEVDVNVLNAHRRQPIALAALGRSREIFEMLFDHKDVHINMHLRGGPLLQHAAGSGGTYGVFKRDIVRKLATHEMLDVKAPLYYHSPVLVWAAGNQNPYLMKLLLERADIDVNVPNAGGDTALHRCLSSYPRTVPSSREILKLLLSQKDINLHVRNNSGQTPAEVAKKNGCLNVYEQLLSETNAGPQSAGQRNASHAGGSVDANPSKRCVIMLHLRFHSSRRCGSPKGRSVCALVHVSLELLQKHHYVSLRCAEPCRYHDPCLRFRFDWNYFKRSDRIQR